MKKTRFIFAACGLIGCVVLIYAYGGARLARSVVDSHSDAVSGEIPAWQADPEQAAAIAQSEKKDILIEFDGPSSAEDPAAFRAAIFDTPQFRTVAGRRYVLVRLTSSADASPDQATQVATWGQRLGVTAFPTLALLDGQCRNCAAVALTSKDMGEAFKALDKLAAVKTARDDAFSRANTADGVDRARHLDEGLQCVYPPAGESYADVMRQILALDPGNAAGLRAKYQNTVAEIDINHAIQAEVYPLIDGGNLPGAVKRIDRIIAETAPSAEQRQLLLAFKGQLFFSLHDPQNAEKTFDEAIRIAPNSGAAAKVLAARAQVLGSPS